MKTKDLMLIKCLFCKKIFADKDEVCTISSRIFYRDDLNFMATWVASGENGVSICREANFHKSCFIKFAGEDYVP